MRSPAQLAWYLRPCRRDHHRHRRRQPWAALWCNPAPPAGLVSGDHRRRSQVRRFRSPMIQNLGPGIGTLWRNPGGASEAPLVAWFPTTGGWQAQQDHWPALRLPPVGPRKRTTATKGASSCPSPSRFRRRPGRALRWRFARPWTISCAPRCHDARATPKAAALACRWWLRRLPGPPGLGQRPVAATSLARARPASHRPAFARTGPSLSSPSAGPALYFGTRTSRGLLPALRRGPHRCEAAGGRGEDRAA